MNNKLNENYFFMKCSTRLETNITKKMCFVIYINKSSAARKKSLPLIVTFKIILSKKLCLFRRYYLSNKKKTEDKQTLL